MTERTIARKTKTWWVLDWRGVTQREGYETPGADYWWFPDVGEPGWGTSMHVGTSIFDTRKQAANVGLRAAKDSLKNAQERVATFEKIVAEEAVTS